MKKLWILAVMGVFLSLKTLSAAEPVPSAQACSPETTEAAQKVANELTALYGPEQKALTKELADQRGKLFQKLAAYGNCAVPILEKDFWKTPDAPRKIMALYGFGAILKKDAQGYLLEGLQDPDRDVRIIAVYMLSPHRDEKTENALIDMLAKETDESAKMLVMASLLDFDNDKALAAVQSCQNDKNPKVQQAAKALLERFNQLKSQKKGAV
jgi:hypothetical protein